MINKVREFHELFEQPVIKTPTIPSAERVQLRYDLIDEEARETMVAGFEKDLIEVADGLADTMYVLCGAILEYGLQDVFGDIFNAVHESNMSKACKDIAEAEATVAYYKEERGVEAFYKKHETKDLYIVYRAFDDKILKSINYKPVDLKPFLNLKE